MPGIVTDNHLISLLEKQGMDRDYVELWHDYAPRSKGKEYSPYARFYQDKVSGQRIMVVGILPRVSAAGFPILSRWRTSGNKFIAEENCFEAEVEGGTVRIVVPSDQPTGARKGDGVFYHPQLFLDGAEQHCGNPIWLDTDPVNPNYHFNVIEWDYGFCKRRVRIFEGRFRERWIFPANPNGEVRIKHNFAGNLRLKLGEYKINNDEEFVSAEVFNRAKYPLEIGASLTVYPDASPETSSVDGYVTHAGTNLTWGEVRGGVGTGANDAATHLAVQLTSGTTAWSDMQRSITLFDISALGAGATVSAVTQSLYGKEKIDTLGVTPDINIYLSDPASNTEVVAGDFNSLETTAYCDTPITYTNFSVVGYNDFAFNADPGIVAVQAAIEGVLKTGARNANYDVANNEPGYTASKYYLVSPYSADEGDTTKDPKLVVTYTTETVYNTPVGAKTSWGWNKCDYGSAEECPVGLKTSWGWGVPTAGVSQTIQGSKTSFVWGET